VDNTFLSRALDAKVFEPYASPLLTQIPDDLKLDPVPPSYRWTLVRKHQRRSGLVHNPQSSPSATLEDLAQPAYKGLLVVQNPATSSPGLAFLLATIAQFGEDGYLDYWRALRANDVLVTNGWSQAYFEDFTVGSAGSGDRPLVVSYTTSPPPMSSTPPTAALNRLASTWNCLAAPSAKSSSPEF